MDQDQPTSGAARDMGSRAPHGDSGRTPSLSPPGSDLDGLVERLTEPWERIDGAAAWKINRILRERREAASAIRSLRALRERVEGELESLRASRDHAPATCAALEGAWTVPPCPPAEAVLLALSEGLQEGLQEDAGLSDEDRKAMRWQIEALGEALDRVREISSAKPAERESSRDELLDRLSQLEAELKRRDEALREIVSAFNQPRFAGDTDADYFLRCIRAVKERVRAALQPQEGGDA